ncbi:MAG: hypothetical protein JNK64_20010 [Myxococcales bacterium]|nr:hypothetical protein [Myxococcales bacterium]
MRTKLACVLMLTAATAGACKSKKADKSGAGTGTAAGAATGSGSAAGTGAGTQSATTTATGPLKAVTECPPALKDADKGLSRTIPAGCATSVEGEYYVDGELTIEAGAKLSFKAGAVMYVGYSDASKLIVKGTADKPVTFTSGGDAVAGAWKGVHLYAKAARSQIDGLVLEFAETGLEIDAPDVAIKSSTLRAAKAAALRVADEVTLAAFDGNTIEQPGVLALSLPPSAMIGLGATNKLPADAVVELRGGTASASGTWPNLGAPVRVAGEVYVEGKPSKATITIAAGATFHFDSGGALYVGYGGDGELKVAGTTEAPVTFAAATDPAPGAWEKGIIAYAKGAITLDHAVVQHGGVDGRGALRSEGGKLAVTGSTFKDNKVGLSLDDATELRGFDQNQLVGNTEQAIALFPRHLGALGAANTYADGQVVLVHGGAADKPATWALQKAAALTVDGELYVDGGAVTIPAGATYAFADGAGLYVGYGNTGTLIVQGTADQPVTLKGVRDEVGAWKGVELYSKAVASTLTQLHVSDAATACVRASGGAAVTIDGLVGTKCETAALTWDCGSKVKQSAVKAAGGTPKGALAPEGC